MINLKKTPVPTIGQPCTTLEIRWCIGAGVWHLGLSGAGLAEISKVRMEWVRREWKPRVWYSLAGGSREYQEEELHPTLDSLMDWIRQGA